jgi:hypothetical protein
LRCKKLCKYHCFLLSKKLRLFTHEQVQCNSGIWSEKRGPSDWFSNSVEDTELHISVRQGKLVSNRFKRRQPEALTNCVVERKTRVFQK